MNSLPRRHPVSRLIREPLVHFLLLGAAVFALSRLVGTESGPRRADTILVTQGNIDRMIEAFARTWQRPPTTAELRGLVDDYVREEAAYREAVAMGLDLDDTIIRRRLRQKLEFLAHDLALAEPTEEQLRAYFDQHGDDFRVDPRASFRHVYLNMDRRGEDAPRDAAELLEKLREGVAPEELTGLGDPFLLPSAFEDVSETDVARQFGGDFAEQVFDVQPGDWAGPIESGYGLHLVLVERKTPGRRPELSEVRDQVVREWQVDQRRLANEAFYRAMLDRYEVVIEPFGEASPEATSTGEDR
jgi:hypothetical protein